MKLMIRRTLAVLTFPVTFLLYLMVTAKARESYLRSKQLGYRVDVLEFGGMTTKERHCFSQPAPRAKNYLTTMQFLRWLWYGDVNGK